MDQFLLAYLFVCFSVGLVCMGVTMVLVHRTRSRVAAAFLAFYVALTVLVLSSLLLAFVDVLPGTVAPEIRGVLVYLEAIVGFYGVLFALPMFAHRVFGLSGGSRDRFLLAIVGIAVVIQHVTEYGLGGRWDDRGDLLENLLFVGIFSYTLFISARHVGKPGVDRTLAIRFLVLLVIGVPVVLHDLFLVDVTGLRGYPLGYNVLSVVLAWTLYRGAGRDGKAGISPDWGLSDRESEVASLVLRGLSNKEIADELVISNNTVKSHMRAIFEKSGCRSRFALMSAAASTIRNPEQPSDSHR